MATTQFYGKAFLSAFNKEIDLGEDEIKVLLLDNTYAPLASHQYKSDLSGEITGDGYTAGGATLSSTSVTFDEGAQAFVFDADDVVWPGSTFTAAYAIIYDNTPADDASRPLIAFVDFGGDQVATSGVVTIVWDTDGIAAVSVN